MNNRSTRLGLAACAAFAMAASAAVMPAAAQSTTYPAGSSDNPYVNNQMNSSNSYNPATSTGTVDTTNKENPANYPGEGGNNCADLVGNSKLECAHNAKAGASPDNSNNPDQQN